MNKQGTKGISWTDWSSNPIYVMTLPTTERPASVRGWHCTKVSNGVDPSGCDFCYAESTNMGRFGTGLPFTADSDDKVEWRLNEDELRTWTRKGKPGRVFPFDMTDIFHHKIPHDFLVKCFAAMVLSPRLTFQVLTKRPTRMMLAFTSEPFWYEVWRQAVTYAEAWGLPAPAPIEAGTIPDNVWPGTTVATQKDADIRLRVLCRTPGTLWVSLEPQLSPVSFERWFAEQPGKIKWIVQGGESGSDRPFLEGWARDTRDECRAHGVSYFLKQFGAVWAKEHGVFGIDSHGKKLENFPEDLRIQEFPQERVTA